MIASSVANHPIVGTGGELTTIGYLNIQVVFWRTAETADIPTSRMARMVSTIKKFLTKLVG